MLSLLASIFVSLSLEEFEKNVIDKEEFTEGPEASQDLILEGPLTVAAKKLMAQGGLKTET